MLVKSSKDLFENENRICVEYAQERYYVGIGIYQRKGSTPTDINIDKIYRDIPRTLFVEGVCFALENFFLDNNIESTTIQ